MENQRTLWIAVWHHCHGLSTSIPFLVPENQELTEEQVIEAIGDEFEPEEEWVELFKYEDRQILKL